MSTADEINKLKDLLHQGIISEEDFETEKNKLLKKGKSKFKFNRKTITISFIVIAVLLGVFIFTQTSTGGGLL